MTGGLLCQAELLAGEGFFVFIRQAICYDLLDNSLCFAHTLATT